ncbi:MAG: DUF3313 domain-containing protein [Syntrophales bacterium]|jgi:hypothetical protein
MIEKQLKLIMLYLIGLALIIFPGCAAGPKYSGFLGDNYKYLKPGPEGGVGKVWLDPDADFQKYHKIMLDSVVFYYAPDSEDKSIDANEMKELTDAFNQAFVDALKDTYPLVSEPGPDVVRLRVAITDIKKSMPVVSGVTSVIPAGLALSIAKKGTTGTWSGAGEASMELMAMDSMSNKVIAAAVDKRSAGFTERFTRLGSAKEAFKYWAGRLKWFIETEGGKKVKK